MGSIREERGGVPLGVLAVAMAVLVAPAPVRAAGGIVGTGSAGSCTETAFSTVFQNTQSTGGGTITFDCGAAPHTIVFSSYKAVSTNTELVGGDLISLSGGDTVSLFQVFSARTLTLRNIVLTRASGLYGAIENFGTLVAVDVRLEGNAATDSGGAILNHGDLQLTNTVVAANRADESGAGILTDGGTITITTSRLSDNVAVVGGGGIFIEGGAVTVAQSTMTGNVADFGGGVRQEAGVLALTDVTLSGNGFGSGGARVTLGGGALSWGNGNATLTNVTISGNWGRNGGGFDHDSGTTTLTNVTISGNEALGGGAFDQGGGSVDLTNVTVIGNRAPSAAGGIANRAGTLTLTNTVLADNTNPDASVASNCFRTVAPAAASFDLSSDATCGFGAGRDGVTLAFGPLGDNGGLTATHVPLAGNPAIDGGTSIGCPATDQRGVTRPNGPSCDVGAVEFGSLTTTTLPGGACAALSDRFALADCALAELLDPALCTPEVIDRKLGKTITAMVGRARKAVGRAGQATKAKKLAKLVRQATGQLDTIIRKAVKAKKTPAACRATLATLVGERRQLVGTLSAP